MTVRRRPTRPEIDFKFFAFREKNHLDICSGKKRGRCRDMWLQTFNDTELNDYAFNNAFSFDIFYYQHEYKV
jgi:hypothetical protein